MFKFNIFKPNKDIISDNRSPEEKAMDEERVKYDEQAEGVARHINSEDYVHRFPNAEIEKEDVIRNDAKVENQARDLLHIGGISEKDFELLVNNSLKLSVHEDSTYENEGYEEIKGEVSGQKVSIFKRYPENNRYNDDSRYQGKFWGTINDKPLSKEEVEILFNKLHEIVVEKEKGLHESHQRSVNRESNKRYHQILIEEDEKKKEKERLKLKEIDEEEKRKKSVEDDLKKII